MELTLRIRKRLGSRERDARSLRESRHWPISVELLIRTPIRLIGADSPTATHISASNGWEPVSFHLLNIKDKVSTFSQTAERKMDEARESAALVLDQTAYSIMSGSEKFEDKYYTRNPKCRAFTG